MNIFKIVGKEFIKTLNKYIIKSEKKEKIIINIHKLVNLHENYIEIRKKGKNLQKNNNLRINCSLALYMKF